MDRMPSEILLEIFLLLHQTDKVECMKVCKKWEYNIREFCLLHTLCISTRQQAKKLIQIFKNQPHQCELVDRVFVFSQQDILPLITPLLSNFPNPREVCLPILNINQQDAKSKTFQSWANHIEHLTEYQSLTMTSNMLGCHVFSRLETLSVFGEGREFDCLPKLIEVLPNAPILKELRLNRFQVSICRIEAIHAAAPILESFYCDNTIIFIEDGPLKIPSSMNIQPATCIKSFSLNLQTISYDIIHTAHFFEYVGLKYPNLDQLGLTNQYHDLYQYRYLNIDANQKKEVYSDALIPLCRKLGPRLKQLSTFISGSVQDMFEWMDDAACRVKELDIDVSACVLDDFKNAEQPTYIEKLTLRDVICHRFNWLEKCTALTELQLLFNKPYNNNHHLKRKINFNRLIKACPKTVKSLSLANVELEYDQATIIQLSSMRNLDFRRVRLLEGLDRFIAKCFPQLLIMKFHFCDMSYKAFVFPGLRLFRLQIDDVFTKKKKGAPEVLLVKTTDNADSRLYKKMHFKMGEASMGVRYTKYDKSIYPENKLLDLKRFDKDPLIIFECASVKNIMY